jgi:membrane protein DedA with SNARE-associated domain
MRGLATHWRVVLWPAFLAACLLEVVVFALVDPGELHTPGGGAVAWSGTAVYSLAFLVFWAASAAASALTLTLSRRAEDVNAPPGGAAASD